ncbi:hypothetical protein Tco_0701308 [Tanacetum coccineum]
MDSQFQSLKEEMHEMRKNYNNRRGDNASKNDDTPMCERHEANYIQFEGYQNQNSHDSYSHQSHHDPNDSEKSLTELNNDVKNDLEDFKSCIRSMRTVHDKLFDRDDQSKTDLEKSITKFLDGQRVSNIKIDEWEKSQNVSSEQIDRTDPPPPQAHNEQVNAVFTRSGKSDDPPKTQKDPPPPIIIHNIFKDKIVPIVNKVDARVQNFKNHFVKEAAKFVQNFKSLAKEADDSLNKIKVLECEIERLLREAVSQDIMSIVQNNYVVDS